MSADTKEEDNGNQVVPELPCPVCIEAASEIIGGGEHVPEYALRKYTFAELEQYTQSRGVCRGCIEGSIVSLP